MSNSFYNNSSYPAQRAKLVSATMRAEFLAISQAFDKLPNPIVGGSKGFSGGLFQDPIIQGVSGGSIDNLPIGATTPAAGTFSDLRVTADATLANQTPRLSQVNNLLAAHAGAANPHTVYRLKRECSFDLKQTNFYPLTGNGGNPQISSSSIAKTHTSPAAWTSVAFTTVSNRGTPYSVSAGTFTAPVAGVYLFTAAANVSSLNSASTANLFLAINGSADASFDVRYAADGVQQQVQLVRAVYLAANDVVELKATVANLSNFQLASYSGILLYEV